MEKADPNVDPKLEALARTLRGAFIDEKSRALKKPYKPSPRHDQMEFYRRAAMQVQKLEADPHDYIRAAIMYCRVKGGPFANSLAGPAARAWYTEFLEGKGIDASRLGHKPQKIDSKETEPTEVQYACDADLKMDIEIGLCMLRLNTGSEDVTKPANLEILRNKNYAIPIAARALLGYADEETLVKFSPDIWEYFSTQPNYTAAAERAGYPIHLILQWTRQNLRS